MRRNRVKPQAKAMLGYLLLLLLELGWLCNGQSTSIAPTPSPTMIEEDEEESLSAVEEHLAAIIGVPTGIGLALIGLLGCVLWLSCSSYIDYRKNRPMASGTHSTNMPHSKGGSLPMGPLRSTTGGTSDPVDSNILQTEPDSYFPEPEQSSVANERPETSSQ